MKLHGGRVDPRIDVTTDSDSGVRGAIALSAIEEGTELLFCPWKLVIGSDSRQDQMAKGDGMCRVVEQMAHELRRAPGDSLWHPYLDHLELPRLPAAWEASALGELQDLALRHDAARHVTWFRDSCGGDPRDAAALRALVAFVSRASEVGMVPVYDLLNHHNGKRNAKLSVTEEGVRLRAVGTRGIPAGHEIYLSYGLKTAAAMYRDYGFVEEWPAAWNWQDAATSDNFAFVQLPRGVVAVNPSADYLKSIWHSDMSQSEYETAARRHTESLSVDDLERVAQAIDNRLNEFTSTREEDETSLAKKESLLIEQRLVASDTTNTEDVISAIQYRIAFKSALINASSYVDRIGREKTGSREL